MLRVVLVCTGNLCRSPQAEQLLRAGLSPDLQAQVELGSAGTAAAEGQPMNAQAAAWSRSLGGDPGGHRSRYLTPKVLRQVDLALGMAREHRREVVSLEPAMTKVTFTLRELARLTALAEDHELEAAVDGVEDPAARLRALLDLLGRRRGAAPPPGDPAADDVVDPIGREPEVFEQSARQVADAVPQVLRLLRLAARTPGA